MKQKLKDKSKEFLFIRLDKQDLVDIYTLLHKQFQIAESSKGDTYKYNSFSFEIDDYEIESIEDIQKFKHGFQGRLHISLRNDDGINLSLDSYSSASNLSLSWTPSNPASGGLAGEIAEVLDRKKRKWLQCFFSEASAFLLAMLLTITLYWPLSSLLSEGVVESMFFLAFGLYIIVSSLFFLLKKKYSLILDFRDNHTSVFETHASEIKVGILIAVLSSCLTLIVQYAVKLFNP